MVKKNLNLRKTIPKTSDAIATPVFIEKVLSPSPPSSITSPLLPSYPHTTFSSTETQQIGIPIFEISALVSSEPIQPTLTNNERWRNILYQPTFHNKLVRTPGDHHFK